MCWDAKEQILCSVSSSWKTYQAGMAYIKSSFIQKYYSTPQKSSGHDGYTNTTFLHYFCQVQCLSLWGLGYCIRRRSQMIDKFSPSLTAISVYLNGGYLSAGTVFFRFVTALGNASHTVRLEQCFDAMLHYREGANSKPQSPSQPRYCFSSKAPFMFAK